TSLDPGLRSSTMRTASKTSRISAARSGWRSQYSLIVGFSPRLWRARNSSASNSTGLWTSLDDDMASILFLVELDQVFRFLISQPHDQVVDVRAAAQARRAGVVAYGQRLHSRHGPLRESSRLFHLPLAEPAHGAVESRDFDDVQIALGGLGCACKCG